MTRKEKPLLSIQITCIRLELTKLLVHYTRHQCDLILIYISLFFVHCASCVCWFSAVLRHVTPSLVSLSMSYWIECQWNSFSFVLLLSHFSTSHAYLHMLLARCFEGGELFFKLLLLDLCCFVRFGHSHRLCIDDETRLVSMLGVNVLLHLAHLVVHLDHLVGDLFTAHLRSRNCKWSSNEPLALKVFLLLSVVLLQELVFLLWVLESCFELIDDLVLVRDLGLKTSNRLLICSRLYLSSFEQIRHSLKLFAGSLLFS